MIWTLATVSGLRDPAHLHTETLYARNRLLGSQWAPTEPGLIHHGPNGVSLP